MEKRSSQTRRHGAATGKTVASAMTRFRDGLLKAGQSKQPLVKTRQQAIAIGLSEARHKGAKVPAGAKRH
ncbi:MAG: L-histidine N(alpha)-methyltransferase [Myxococcales bacterium]|nr:L-histidine N(alpha)-methyltransferase [Myxococcales bacterium]